MLKNRIATMAITAALGLSIGLVGCAGNKTDSATGSSDSAEATSGEKERGRFDASGYQGELEDGMSIVYLQIGPADDDTVMVSLTDDEHQGDDAEVYSGTATTDADGKITVTDDESGKSISFTLTENEDGTAEVDVDGHGKGTLKSYEGSIFSVIGSMAEDDSE